MLYKFRIQSITQTMELELGERRLEQEIESRLNIETKLETKLAELEQTQLRVRTLQADLNERQQIFSDQVSSLEKTRAMARNAALLARRAAMAQQKARTEALKERAARERLEVSAKKAVHIARSAISKSPPQAGMKSLPELLRSNRFPTRFNPQPYAASCIATSITGTLHPSVSATSLPACLLHRRCPDLANCPHGMLHLLPCPNYTPPGNGPFRGVAIQKVWQPVSSA